MPTTTSDLDSLDALLTLLRRQGVAAFIGLGVEVRLGDLPAVVGDAKPVTLGRDPDLCNCGHSLSVGHSDAGCIVGVGCDAALCDSAAPVGA